MSQVVSAQPLEISDFSGGRTDNYLDGPTNAFKRADNLVLISHGSKAKLLSRDGSDLYSQTYPLVNASIARIGIIHNFRNTLGDNLLVQSDKKLFYLGTGWTNLAGPTSNNAFPSTTTVANSTSYAQWNDHFFLTNDAYAPVSKVYRDGSGNLQLRTAGLPRLASNPSVAATANTGKSFIYRFIYRFDYTVNTVAFLDRGGYVEVSLNNADAPNVNHNAVTSIPVLSNSTTYNWDTSTIKVEIYRTTNTGQVFYLVGNVTNGTTTFNDSVSDATLQTHEQLYTTGGIVENDPVPPSKLIHITGDNAFYANIKDGSEIRANRLIQAIPGDPDSVPASFFVDVQDEIVGLSSTQGLPILLCKNSVYRVDGLFDSLGNGGMFAQKISDTATCVSAQSVVQTIEGVFWAGEDSYYYTNGYQVTKISKDWASSYKDQVVTAPQRRRIQGKYDKLNRRIWWTVQDSEASQADCNACDILNLDWGIKITSAFTSASGGTEFAPTAIEFIDGKMLRGDVHGYLLQHEPGLATDPKIDVLITPANWHTNAVIFDYESCSFNFGTSFLRKYTTDVISTCGNKSNLSLQIVSDSDDGRQVLDLKPIRFRGDLTWDDENFIWGDPSFIWAFEGLIENRRRIPAAGLRCSYKQIRMTNAYVNIVNSDSLGLATTSSSLLTAVLLNGDITWPADPIDYKISFASDNYANEFLITNRTDDTITFTNPSSLPILNGDQKWEIRGYPKGEIFNLLSYAIAYRLMGNTQQFYEGAQSGDVAS